MPEPEPKPKPKVDLTIPIESKPIASFGEDPSPVISLDPSPIDLTDLEVEQNKYLASLGVEFCSKCGSRELYGLNNKRICPTLTPDCPVAAKQVAIDKLLEAAI